MRSLQDIEAVEARADQASTRSGSALRAGFRPAPDLALPPLGAFRPNALVACVLVNVICVMAAPGIAADLAALPAYNAVIGESSISGISSGAFMALQFGTAWSSVIKGVGVVAGGPFYCAQADASDIFNWYTLPVLTATGPCMKGPAPSQSVFSDMADKKAASGEIDPTNNLSRQKIYLFHGFNDPTVAKSVTDAAAAFYGRYLGDAGRGNLYYQTALGAGHAWIVQDSRATDLNDCTVTKSPFIDRCGYDQAGIILRHIYGALNKPGDPAALSGTVKSFAQAGYINGDTPGTLSMGDEGYVFVPRDCTAGMACRVHVALHGCLQTIDDIGQRFVTTAGLNAWADTNRIIVLYPQAKARAVVPTNPSGCWDWWSYVTHDDNYVTKSGRQIMAIKAMLDALTAGYRPGPATQPAPGVAPAALAVTDTADTAAALVWAPVSGAELYNVARARAEGPFTPAGSVAGPSFGDTGLTPQTSYRWRVTAIVGGAEGPASAEATATTKQTPAPCDNPGSC